MEQGTDLPISGSELVELLRDVLKKGVPFRFRANGVSMSPSVRDGDVITVYPLRGASTHLGDVVAYLSGESGQLVVHRVIGRRGDRYLISGDNAPGKPDLVPSSSLLGRVTRVERNGKDVRFGLGPERLLIAVVCRRLMSRNNSLLPRFLQWYAMTLQPSLRKIMQKLPHGLND